MVIVMICISYLFGLFWYIMCDIRYINKPTEYDDDGEAIPKI